MHSRRPTASKACRDHKGRLHSFLVATDGNDGYLKPAGITLAAQRKGALDPTLRFVRPLARQ